MTRRARDVLRVEAKVNKVKVVDANVDESLSSILPRSRLKSGFP